MATLQELTAQAKRQNVSLIALIEGRIKRRESFKGRSRYKIYQELTKGEDEILKRLKHKTSI